MNQANTNLKEAGVATLSEKPDFTAESITRCKGSCFNNFKAKSSRGYNFNSLP